MTLSEGEMARWIAWKRANDAVLAAVAQEIQSASGLSAADFAVLSRVIENGDGRMRQHDLGRMLDWKRARLSRQLSRMAERGLVLREDGVGRRMVVSATDEGRAALAEARPAHARAVRRALFDRAPDGAFWEVIQELGA
ncbi:MarR family winged helix-turn-helix transcriptional regulator [Lentzea sp. CA-135723]|uniref:MarR family winged helix-turn-helix transcriptional regulator n=1 Tax=Lentzea sp. CA-135723 TaxID=3239950 RepID=UPI003D931B4D